MADVSVLIDGGAADATSDADGRFSFAELPVGEHRVQLLGSQTVPVDIKETLSPNKSLQVTYYVEVQERYSTTVRGRSVEREAVEQTLRPAEFKRIPGTQGDTLKALQSLPGVARTPFFGGQLVVWGSRPQDTRVFVDGVFIPTLYHFGGLRSTVNGEFIDALVFTPGAYGSEYGRGIGGLVEVQTRRPRDQGLHGYVQLDTLDASFALEGPVAKNVSVAVGGRYSLVQFILPAFTPNNFQLTPAYWDYQAKLHWNASPRDEVDLFIFGSDDTIRLSTRNPNPAASAQFDSHTFYHRGLLRWLHRFPGRVTLQVTASSGYNQPFQVRANIGSFPLRIDARVTPYVLRAIVRAPLTSSLRLDSGLDFEGATNNLDLALSQNGAPREGDPPGPPRGAGFATETTIQRPAYLAPFASLRFSVLDRRLTLVPSVRIEIFNTYSSSRYAIGGKTGRSDVTTNFIRPSPRLSLRYRVNDLLDLKGAVGVYYQSPDPTAISYSFGSQRIEPEFSIHYVAGIELRPTPTLLIEVEGFYKDLRNLVVRGATSQDPPVINDGVGRIYGGELLVRQELFKGFFGWIAYTLSRSERADHPGEKFRVFQYDQTHIFSIIGSYQFRRGYQIGLRFRYVTGNPYTPITGGYYDVNQDTYTPLYGGTYNSRLPAFHSLDLRFDKTWTFRRWRLLAYIDIQNLYNRRNPEGVSYNFDYSQQQPVSGQPIFPVIGVRGEF